MLGWLGDKLTEVLAAGILFLAEFICKIVLAVFNVILSCFEFIFSENMVALLWQTIDIDGTSVLDIMMNTFIGVGLALVVILVIYSLFSSLWAPLWSGGRKGAYPTGIIVRSVVAIVLVLCSKPIVNTVFGAMRMFYVDIAKLANTYGVPIGTGTTLSVPGESVFDLSSHLPTDGEGVYGIIVNLSESISVVLAVIVLVIVGWNLIQYYLEIFERYAAILTVMMIAPLPLACSAHPSTEDISKRWFRWLVGQLLLWVSQIMFIIIIKVILDSPDSFTSTFSDSAAGFLSWACIAYGFVNIARRFEEMINKLGLIAATTGEGLFRDLGSFVAAASSLRKGIDAAGKATGTVGGGILGATAAGTVGVVGAGIRGVAAAKAGVEGYKEGTGDKATKLGAVAAGTKSGIKGAVDGATGTYKVTKDVISDSLSHPVETAKNAVSGAVHAAQVAGDAYAVGGAGRVAKEAKKAISGYDTYKEAAKQDALDSMQRRDQMMPEAAEPPKPISSLDGFKEASFGGENGEGYQQQYDQIKETLGGTGVSADDVITANIGAAIENDEQYQEERREIEAAEASYDLSGAPQEERPDFDAQKADARDAAVARNMDTVWAASHEDASALQERYGPAKEISRQTQDEMQKIKSEVDKEQRADIDKAKDLAEKYIGKGKVTANLGNDRKYQEIRSEQEKKRRESRQDSHDRHERRRSSGPSGGHDFVGVPVKPLERRSDTKGSG